MTAIDGFVAGDDIDIERDVTDVTITDPIASAKMTFKAQLADADPGALQKSITTSPVVGQGQVTQDGSAENGNGTASLLFKLTDEDTLALGTAIRYYWDIQVITASGLIYTPHSGTILLVEGVTDATS